MSNKVQKINIISLGCSKNLVDSEFLLNQLHRNGLQVVHDADGNEARTVIINTCGFIGDAKEESVNMILQYADAKQKGEIDKLYVMGCLSQRYSKDLKKELPEVDQFFGKFDIKKIVKVMGGKPMDVYNHHRIITTPPHYAYLKISEGCNRTCSFCAIPQMTGSHKTKPIEDLVEEAKNLAAKGVKELLIIAQDLSYYGIDLYKESKLAELIEKLSEVEGIQWIKLHYAYPTTFPTNILPVIANNPKVCNYLDMALQHSSNNMLKAMRRGTDRVQTLKLIEKIRKEVPGIVLRTTLLTGHPGETEADFEDLLAFVKEVKFDRLGVFPYSHEDDTYAQQTYEDDVPDDVKRSRANKIMEVQKDISNELNLKRIGQVLKVVIDRVEGDYFVGRSEYDSPEVDPEVLVTSATPLTVGEFYDVKITSSDDYDLYGVIALTHLTVVGKS